MLCHWIFLYYGLIFHEVGYLTFVNRLRHTAFHRGHSDRVYAVRRTRVPFYSLYTDGSFPLVPHRVEGAVGTRGPSRHESTATERLKSFGATIRWLRV